MELDTKFSFGKYKGLTLQQVYQGTLNMNRALLRNYLNQILNNRHPYIPKAGKFDMISKFSVNEDRIEIFESSLVPGGNGMLTLTTYPADFGNVEDLIQDFINYHFRGDWLGVLETISEYNSSQEPTSIPGADSQYIIWCLRNVNEFNIEQRILNELEKLKISRLVGIEIMYLRKNIYEYGPIFKIEYYKFPVDINSMVL